MLEAAARVQFEKEQDDEDLRYAAEGLSLNGKKQRKRTRSKFVFTEERRKLVRKATGGGID